jgi:hypothetical protein
LTPKETKLIAANSAFMAVEAGRRLWWLPRRTDEGPKPPRSKVPMTVRTFLKIVGVIAVIGGAVLYGLFG